MKKVICIQSKYLHFSIHDYTISGIIDAFISFPFFMVAHISRLLLVSLLAVGVIVSQSYALTSSELKSWAVGE